MNQKSERCFSWVFSKSDHLKWVVDYSVELMKEDFLRSVTMVCCLIEIGICSPTASNGCETVTYTLSKTLSRRSGRFTVNGAGNPKCQAITELLFNLGKIIIVVSLIRILFRNIRVIEYITVNFYQSLSMFILSYMQ